MRWVRNDLDNRRHHLPELLAGIRLALLPSECLLEAVACEELVMADKRSRYLYVNVFVQPFDSFGFNENRSSCNFDVSFVFRIIVEEAMQCKKRILQNDGIVTGPCARPRKAGHTLLILGGQTFMCDKIYQVKREVHTLS